MGAESKTKAATPKLLTVNKALKLAEAWVNNMSGSKMMEPREVQCEGRPPRLGLGAKVAPNAKPAASADPVERRLLGKLNAAKRKSLEDSRKDPAEENESSGEDGGEPESRTNAFVKKRAIPPITSPQPKKRK